MNKKVIISIVGLIVAIALFLVIWKMIDNNRNTEDKLNLNENENVIEVSEEGVTDECTEEWMEYNNELQAAFEEASSNLAEKNKHYLLKSENGYINVYYVGMNNEEYLYKQTGISVDYLSPEDIEDLEAGIEVVGNEELNKMLEDFE